MKGMIVAQHIEEFNNAITNLNNPEYTVVYVGNNYHINEVFNKDINEIFERFEIVSGIYGDIKNNFMTFPPFAPNKYYGSFILNTPIIVRTNIGELMTSNSYRDFFDKTKTNKMYYHIAKPIFIKHEVSNNTIIS